MSDESRVWHGIDVTINWHAKYIEQVARAEKAEAEVARLTELTAVCTCPTGPAFEGPQADCAVHGAVRAYNETVAELARVNDQRNQFHAELVDINTLAADIVARAYGRTREDVATAMEQSMRLLLDTPAEEVPDAT